ncbi:MAG: tetratricopeptide repeat protein [Planctomycetota bacterium]|nr:tetratricopeptide repeat protein [Planctomycetota bacterium]
MVRSFQRLFALAFIFVLPIQLTACKEKAGGKSTPTPTTKNDAKKTLSREEKLALAKKRRIEKLKWYIATTRGPTKHEQSLKASIELVNLEPKNEEFRALMKKHAKNVDYQNALDRAAKLMRSRGPVDLNEALQFAEKALILNGTSAAHLACGEIQWRLSEGKRRLGDVAGAKQRFAIAHVHFTEAASLDNSNDAALYYRAELHRLKGATTEDQAKHYQRVIGVGKTRRAYHSLANAKMREIEGRVDKALSAFAGALNSLRRLGNSVMQAALTKECYLMRAELYRRKRDYRSALASIENVLQLAKNDPDALVLRAHVRLNQSDYDKALGDIEKASQFDKRNAFLLALRGHLKMLKGDRDGALKDCEEALKIDPRCYYPFRVRGELRMAQADRAGAAKDFQTAAEYGPRIAANHYRYGRVLQENNDKKGALSAYSKCLGLDANHWRAYCNRATIYQLLDDYSKAFRDVGRALRLQPKNAQIYLQRSKIRSVGFRKESIDYKDGQWNAVLTDLNSAIRLQPNLAEAYGQRAFIFRRRKKFKEALTDYNRAIDFKPADVYIWHGYRGLLYAENRQFQVALEDFNEYLKTATSTHQIYSTVQKERARIRRELKRK